MPGGATGTYYVVINWQGPASTASYSLTAAGVGLSVDLPSPAAAPASSSVTLEIDGSGFTPATQVSLVSGATRIPADEVVYQNSESVSASFDLANVPTGDGYAIEVANNAVTATSPSGFTVYAAPAVSAVTQDNDSIVTSIVAPAAARPGSVYSLTIDYYSDALVGTTVQAPMFQLSASNVEFQLPGQTGFTPGSIQFLGVSTLGQGGGQTSSPPSASAGTDWGEFNPLKPVYYDPSITINFMVTAPGNVTLNLGVADTSAPINWSTYQGACSPQARPPPHGPPSSPTLPRRSAIRWAACKRLSITTQTI